MNNRVLVINTPSVVGEIIDGEVIIMNLKSGNYYSSDKIGAVVWSWIEAAKSEEEIFQLADQRYAGCREQIHNDLTLFFGCLIAENLVHETEAPEENTIAENEPYNNSLGQEIFVTPELSIYTDMKDLMFLDPIHDVGEVGWPQAKDDSDTLPPSE